MTEVEGARKPQRAAVGVADARVGDSAEATPSGRREPPGSQRRRLSELLRRRRWRGQYRRRPGRRRRPAPKAHFFWRFAFPVMVAGAALAVLLLAREGGRAFLDRKVEHVERSVVYGPDEPGYLEFVGATPTLLAVHTHEGGLAGVSFLARTGIDAGGGIVLLPSDLLVEAEGAASDHGEFLGSAYAQGGAAAVRRLAESMFWLGFDDVVELPSEALIASIGPAEPLPYLMLDDLVAVDSAGAATVVYEAGRHDLAAADAAAVYAFRNAGEAEVNRLERQRALWESWLSVIGSVIGAAEDAAAGVLPFQSGLSPFLSALGAGTALVEIPPMQSVVLDAESTPFYVLGDEGRSWLRERSLDLAPWPVPPESFLRPRVQLLDGTGDPQARNELVDDIIAAGGVITVIGNAPQFGVQTTHFAYHRPELVNDPIVNSIAYGLGVDMALVELTEGAPEVVDVTVTVGLDQALR